MNDFSRWYKNKFERISDEPPADLWENISAELDRSMPGSKPSAFHSRYLVLLTLILSGFGVASIWLNSLPGSSVKVNSLLKVETGNPAAIHANDNMFAQVAPVSPVNPAVSLSIPSSEKKQIEPAGSVKSSAPGLAYSPVNEPALVSKTAPDQSVTKVSHALPESVDPLAVTASTFEMQEIESRKAELPERKSGKLAFSTSDLANTDENELPKNDLPKGFYVGITATHHNSWLLNNDTYSGFRSDIVDDAKHYSSNSYSFDGGYRMNDKLAFQAELLINTEKGESYSDYQEGHLITRNVVLGYNQLNIILKRRLALAHLDGTYPCAFNGMAGMYGAYLNSATEYLNGNATDKSGEYLKGNYGAVLGLEMECFLKHNIILSGAVRGDLSLANVYTGNVRVPSSFNRTHTATLGFALGFHYLLHK